MKEPFNPVAYRNEYVREHYDRLSILLPKGTKKLMLARAAELGYINRGKPSITAYLLGLYQQDVQTKEAVNLVNTTE